MVIGKLIAKTVALPVKAVVAILDVLAETVEEVGKAIDPPAKAKR